MKKSVIITAVFAALLSIAACERENISGHQDSGEGIRLTFTCEDIGTKADGTRPGVGNENLIKTVDVFLFSSGDTRYKHHWHFSPEIESNFTCFIQAAVINDGTYKVYSIVNYPGSDPDTDFIISGQPATLDQLKALVLNESTQHTFTAAGASGITPAANGDLALVMTGMAEDIVVEIKPGQTLVGNAEIKLERLPSKVTMDFYLKDEVLSTKGNVTETWTPLTDGSNIRVYLCNGAENAFVGGRDSTSLSIFDYDPNVDNTLISGKEHYSLAFSSSAFYTYPENWEYGSASEPYLKLIVPWKLVRSTAGIAQESQKEFYYKVMLPTNKFESNNWYHLQLDVTQLGGNADDDAVNVPCGYRVVDWRSGSEISSTMSPGYYLDVNVPDVSNINFYGDELDIPYFASGAVRIISVTKAWNKYSDGTRQVRDTDTGVSNADENSLIHINNPLDSDFNGNEYDVSPYTFTIEIGLVNDPYGAYNKTLVVTQYPPLYIEANNTYTDNNSPAKVFVNGSSTTTSTGLRVWDNSGTYTSNTTVDATNYSHYLGSVQTNTSAVDEQDLTANNKNPNIYSISTTILNFSPLLDSKPFETVLGDPRGTATNFSDLKGGNNNTSTLTNYRPTAENTQNVISPKFISASSYGKTYSVSYDGAVKRCASYQESGYPAGRWRLPTQAEILFLQKLNSDGKIPKLYATSNVNAYWAAGHLVVVKESNAATAKDIFVKLDENDSGTTVNTSSYAVTYSKGGITYNPYVRCVYDTWYWGDDPVSGSGWLGFQTSL